MPPQLQSLETRNSGPMTLPPQLQSIDTREVNKEIDPMSYDSIRNEVAPPLQYVNSGQQ